METQEVPDGVQGELLSMSRNAEIDQALHPVHPGRAVVEEPHQRPWVHRAVGGELHALVGGVEVLVAVRRLGQQFVEGQLARGCPPLPHRLAVEQQRRIDATVRGRQHRFAAGELAHQFRQPLLVGFADSVNLVQQHQVGEAQVLVDLGVAPPGRLELRGVDHLHQPAVAEAAVRAVQQQPDHATRVGQSAGLDHDHVDVAAGPCQPGQQVVEPACVDGAAQAAVAQRHSRVDLAGHAQRVDVDLPEVVDHDADPGALRVAQQVVEQTGLPGSEEPRDDDDRDRLPNQNVPFARSLPARQHIDRPQRRCGTGTRCRSSATTTVPSKIAVASS